MNLLLSSFYQLNQFTLYPILLSSTHFLSSLNVDADLEFDSFMNMSSQDPWYVQKILQEVCGNNRSKDGAILQ